MKKPKVGKPYFIAVDTLTDGVGGYHTYDALWHLNVEDAEISGSTVLADGITLFTCGFDELDIIKGSEEPFFQGWLANGSKQGDYYAAPTVIGKAKGKNASFVTLFVTSSYEESDVSGVSLTSDVLVINYKNGMVDEINLAELR